jgi:isopentenyl phosphate kinase
MNEKELVFLKLGGSLITDKDHESTARPDVIQRLADEIARALADRPEMRLVLGHGSGSFGHAAAQKYGTRDGVQGAEAWIGFARVWKEARALNQIVVEALASAGLPVIAFPPSAAVTAENGTARRWDTAPIRAALDAGLLPLINGDVIFDGQKGGTILSTEDLFIYLAGALRPSRILLAGLEEGVWEDFPACTRLIQEITPSTFDEGTAQIGASTSVDVTGGMLEKVRLMLELCLRHPGLQARIFSGRKPFSVREALQGSPIGTLLIHRVV